MEAVTVARTPKFYLIVPFYFISPLPIRLKHILYRALLRGPKPGNVDLINQHLPNLGNCFIPFVPISDCFEMAALGVIANASGKLFSHEKIAPW